MEADWSAEVGGGAERIEADWPGFIDLRSDPESIQLIAEAKPGSALRSALLILNGAKSTFYTSKCDQWRLPAQELDPFEYDFPSAEVWVGMASYIDLIPRNRVQFESFEENEQWVRRAVGVLRSEAIANGRVELVIRAASERRADGFAITLYAVGCGPDTASARVAWEAVLQAAVNVTMEQTRESRASSSIG